MPENNSNMKDFRDASFAIVGIIFSIWIVVGIIQLVVNLTGVKTSKHESPFYPGCETLEVSYSKPRWGGDKPYDFRYDCNGEMVSRESDSQQMFKEEVLKILGYKEYIVRNVVEDEEKAYWKSETELDVRVEDSQGSIKIPGSEGDVITLSSEDEEDAGLKITSDTITSIIYK